MKYVTRLGDALLFANGEANAATLYESNLLVRVIVGWSDDEGREAQATDHQSLADDHLPLDAFFQFLDRNF